MDDPCPMRRRQGVKGREQDVDGFSGRHGPACEHVAQRLARQELLHDEARVLLFDERVHPRDVWIRRQPRQRAGFFLQAAEQRRSAGGFRPHGLQRDRHVEHDISSPIDDAHPSAAELTIDNVGSHLAAGRQGGRRGEDGGTHGRGGRGPFGRGDEQLDGGDPLRMVLTSRADKCRAIGGGCFKHRKKDVRQTWRGHAVDPGSSSRASHARASVQRRFTVAGETSSASAVASMLSPPKNRSSTSSARSGCDIASRVSAASMVSTSSGVAPPPSHRRTA